MVPFPVGSVTAPLPGPIREAGQRQASSVGIRCPADAVPTIPGLSSQFKGASRRSARQMRERRSQGDSRTGWRRPGPRAATTGRVRACKGGPAAIGPLFRSSVGAHALRSEPPLQPPTADCLRRVAAQEKATGQGQPGPCPMRRLLWDLGDSTPKPPNRGAKLAAFSPDHRSAFSIRNQPGPIQSWKLRIFGVKMALRNPR